MAQQKPDCAKAKATCEGTPITAGAQKGSGDGKRLRPSRSRLEDVLQRHLATSDAATCSPPIHGLRCTSIRAHPPILEGEKPWSTPNAIPYVRISTHTSSPLEYTERLADFSAAPTYRRVAPPRTLFAHFLTVVRQNKMLARPSRPCRRRPRSGATQICRRTRWTS